MTFGMVNARATFVRGMHKTITGLKNEDHSIDH